MKYLLVLSLFLFCFGCSSDFSKSKLIQMEDQDKNCGYNPEINDKVEVIVGKYKGYIGHVRIYDKLPGYGPYYVVLRQDNNGNYFYDCIDFYSCDLTPTTKLIPHMVLRQEGFE